MAAKSSPSSRRTRWRRALAAACLALAPGRAMAAHPHALWRVVHDLCGVDHRLTGLAAPCLEVNARAGYAVVPDPARAAHLLLVPTKRITGIEDPQLLAPETPNYWSFAWAARRRLEGRVGAPVPREAVGLAVNAVAGRSQDQLHIHLSCVQPRVGEALEALEPRLSERWSVHKVLGRRWRVRTVAGDDLGDVNPFRLLADTGPDIAAQMGRQTLVVVGAQLRTGAGFYLLSRSADPATGDEGHGEYLLDERCSAAVGPSPRAGDGDGGAPPAGPRSLFRAGSSAPRSRAPAPAA